MPLAECARRRLAMLLSRLVVVLLVALLSTGAAQGEPLQCAERGLSLEHPAVQVRALTC